MPTRVGTANAPSPIYQQQALKPVEAPESAILEIPAKQQRTDQNRKDINVRLQYLRNDPLYDEVKPVQITPNFLDGEGRTNVRLDSGPSEVLNDVRGREDQFTLDKNGFCYVHAPTKFTEWSSQPQMAKEYLPELEQLLKHEIDGCDEIVFYDARIRQEGDQGARVSGLSFNPFARQVHVDNTERSVIEKIRHTTEVKADYYMSGRVRIINIWRPIKHPVYDCGLAIADGGKLHEGDVIECERRRQDTGEYWDTMGVVKYRPGYDWYYMSYQDEPDVLLFKNYDSATDVSARNCLHTAFDMPQEDIPDGAPTRESIEVRAFVFTLPRGLRRPSGGAVSQHPLAVHLEQGNLRFIDEEHSITDRLRTDIDEGNEVKDAVLLLRRQEIRRLERACEALMAERDERDQALQQSRVCLDQAQRQISIQSAHSESLQRKIHELEFRARQQPNELHQQIHALSRELADARMREQTRARSEQAVSTKGGLNPEMACLHERVEHLEGQLALWKAEAMGRGNKAVSVCWQDSVDEAVRREREKDRAVIVGLTREIDQLRAQSEASRAEI